MFYVLFVLFMLTLKVITEHLKTTLLEMDRY